MTSYYPGLPFHFFALTEIYRYSHKRFCSELFNIRDFGMPTRQHQKD